LIVRLSRVSNGITTWILGYTVIGDHCLAKCTNELLSKRQMSEQHHFVQTSALYNLISTNET